ncbi:copper transporter [Brevibacillus dissolubilis]|uniref:copper transporter n=1 Tax=Brevibacillus dissolubilis TaxID=1844116 RepID=UPI001116150B|nr:copper transporter [Brevibacillus dissolubilis]
MIHFRYHLLTIAAIFLALGVGILLGGTAGQSWLAGTQQEFLLSMEQKYDKALKSNSELKQQINQLIVEVEQNNNEVLHLMTTRYADDLHGQSVAVWRAEGVKLGKVERLFDTIGITMQTVTDQPPKAGMPLLIFGRQKPEWLGMLPDESKWVHIETVPNSPSQQWKLLENVQLLIKETRWEHEKS